jgi:putative transferase (TIGR04331 family)
VLLVTTALEETWGTDEEILFLGEWCKLYDRKDTWGKRKSSTLGDPWSDRERRFIAYQYTVKVYNSTIKVLADELNKVHKLNHPVRYWAIICEPWLRLFIDSTYHNWECVSDVIDGGQVDGTVEIKTKLESQIPVDMNDFETKLVSDYWNHYISTLIINSRINKIITRITAKKDVVSKPIESFQQQKAIRKLLSIGLKLLLKFAHYMGLIFNSSKAVFISNPYLSKSNHLKLMIKLGVFPLGNVQPEFYQRHEYNKDFRVGLTLSDEELSEYEMFLYKTVLEQIPYTYVEGFSDLKLASERNKWPKAPPAIVTAVDYFANDIFRYYCANSVLTGSKINLICHGGGGKYKYSGFQDMDFNICDNYFTWGWSEYSSKCVQGFFLKDNGYRRNGNKDEKHLLHVMLSQYRYQKSIDSTPSYEQYINEYLNDQIRLLNLLKPDIKKNVITKLSYDFENSLKDRIGEKCSDISYATMKDDYYMLISKAKLVVTTYNCTTPVEVLAMNIPTIMYWRSKHWELALSATPFFDKLRACGIFHDSPESAALMIEQIWDDVDGWWQSQEVVLACDEFRMWFCRESQHPIRELTDFCKM